MLTETNTTGISGNGDLPVDICNRNLRAAVDEGRVEIRVQAPEERGRIRI